MSGDLERSRFEYPNYAIQDPMSGAILPGSSFAISVLPLIDLSCHPSSVFLTARTPKSNFPVRMSVSADGQQFDFKDQSRVFRDDSRIALPAVGKFRRQRQLRLVPHA